MDEDDGVSQAEVNDEEYAVRQRINKEKTGKKEEKPCRTRFDKLATPNRRLILSLYQDHAYHLEKVRVEKIKQNLQELYAMSPEETEKYFAQLQRESEKILRRQRIRRMLQRMYRQEKIRRQRFRAYRFIERLLRRGMAHAFNNPVPLFVSIRLRNLSDIILEQLCYLCNKNYPDREDPDQVGSFFIAVADWLAIAVEHIHYHVQLKRNKEIEEKMATARDTVQKDEKESVPPVSEKTPIATAEYDVTKYGGEDTDVSTVLLSPDME